MMPLAPSLTVSRAALDVAESTHGRKLSKVVFAGAWRNSVSAWHVSDATLQILANVSLHTHRARCFHSSANISCSQLANIFETQSVGVQENLLVEREQKPEQQPS